MESLKLSNPFIYIITISTISGCSIGEFYKQNLNIFDLPGNKEVSVIDTIEVKVSCNRNNIDDYIDKGWKIKDQTVSEVPCTWKTVKSTPKCNVKKDKGCQITVPDTLGKQIVYTLEKVTKLENKEEPITSK